MGRAPEQTQREKAEETLLANEALNYLEIVKKVIVKTERGVAKRNTVSQSAALSAGPDN